LVTEGQALLVPAIDGARTLTAAVRALDNVGVEPQDIGLRRPTLDDVFLTLTGHRAEERSRDEAQDLSQDGGRRV
jgi:ABC-2 type transport system ATP-binding protein